MKTPLLVSVTLCLALAEGCARREAPSSDATAVHAPARVRVAKTDRVIAPEPVLVTGVVLPVKRAVLSAKVMGSVAEFPMGLGQHVRAGDLIVRLHAPEIPARLAQARAQRDQAAYDLDREKSLLAKEASTPDIIRGLETRLATAEGMLREAQAFESDCAVRAPFDGTLTRKLVHEGDMASPGMPLAQVEGTDLLEVDAQVPESVSGGLAAGMAVSVRVDGQAVTARLAESSGSSDPSSHTVSVVLSLPPACPVHPGSFAEVSVPGAPRSRILMPEAALVREGQLEKVYVVDPSRHVTLRLVRTSEARDGRVEVLSGLDAGEAVVLSPGPDLTEGQEADIQP